MFPQIAVIVRNFRMCLVCCSRLVHNRWMKRLLVLALGSDDGTELLALAVAAGVGAELDRG